MVTRLNPVSLPNGQPAQSYPEFTLAGPIPFEIARDFQGALQHAGPLGPRHTSPLDIEIRDGERDGTYELTTPNPFTITFERPLPQLFATSTNAAHRHLSLEPLSRGGLKLNDRDRSTIFKRYRGRIWRIVRIEDGNGNAIILERNRDGLLERLIHPAGVNLHFHNRNDGLRAGYDAIGLDGSILPVVRYGYDPKGRLVSVKGAFVEDWTCDWDDQDRRISADNGAGTQVRHGYDAQGRVIRVDTGGSYKQGGISYDTGTGQITVTHGDGPGFEKLWFDREGRHFMTANPAGEISYREYSDANDLIRETDANGNAIRYSYDAFGNTQTVTDQEGRETFMIWDDTGHLLSRIDPAGNSWEYEYDDRGNLIQARDPRNNVTDIRVNTAGQPVQTMRQDGLIEFRNYDDHHRLVSVIDFNSAEMRFDYDAFNRVTAITDPGGNVTRLSYEGGTNFHVPTAIIRPDGVQARRKMGATGRIEAITDGEGRQTSYRYGPYNVLEEITDPKGGKLRFQYDSQERLTCVTNQMGLHWVFERDLVGRVVRETDFDGRTLRYVYDAGGRVIRRDNPDGGHLEYDYDRSGLLLELRAFGPGAKRPLVTTYGYDDNGRLIAAANADATIALERDALGRVIAEVTNGQRIESQFDCCGRRVERRIGDQTLRMRHDGMGGLLEWQLEGHAPLSFTRDELGQERRRQSARGFLLEQDWDAVGQLTRQSGPGIRRDYDWTRAYEPRVITDARWGEKRYDYDQNGQITRTQYGDGGAERFAYSPDLNIAATTSDTERFLTWQTSAAGVVRIAHGPQGEVVTLEHDTCGRVIRRTVTRKGFRPQSWTFEWNAQDQLVAADGPQGRWRYGYDPFGRRIFKENNGQREEFLWDGDVLARAGKVDWFFEPDSFRPMARRDAGVLFHIVNDHLGTPKEMFSEGGALAWSVDHDTWGTVRRVGRGVAERGDYWVENVAYELSDMQAEPAAQLCPIRFQGQWEDAETGLYYNRFRYYEPLVGQYASPDPIGLLGGANLLGYVLQPTTKIDPLGLSCCKVLPDFCDFDIGSGFSGVYDAATGAIVVMPGQNARQWGVPVQNGVPRFGGHSIVLSAMKDELGRNPAEPWGFSMVKTATGFDFGFNSITINENLRGRPGNNAAPAGVWQDIMNATGQENCKPRGR